MNHPRHFFARIPVGWHRRRMLGFALPEIALALLIIGLGTGLFLTLAGRMRQRRHCDEYIRDLRNFSAAFAGQYRQSNSWPLSGNAEVALPPDLAMALQGANWLKPSPFGGNYAWVAPDPAGATGHGPARGWGGRGAITLVAFSPARPLALDRADLLYIDSQIDDGNLATGRFRTGFNGWPVFLVEAVQQ